MRRLDTQQMRVYNSETEAFPDLHTEQWRTTAQAQAWVDEVCARPYLAKKYGQWIKTGDPIETVRGLTRTTVKTEVRRVRKITVRPTRKHHGTASGWGNRIDLPRFARNEAYVLHELAHIFAGSHDHGWQFCVVYLDLVRHVLGREAHDRLRAAFREQGAQYTRPRQARRETAA